MLRDVCQSWDDSLKEDFLALNCEIETFVMALDCTAIAGETVVEKMTNQQLFQTS